MPPVTALCNSAAASSSSENPIVFMDLMVGRTPVGRILVELYADVCPKTAENFRSLCTGEKLKTNSHLSYKASKIHSAYPDWALVGGDVVNNNGTSGESIYGHYFGDENFDIKHDRPGRVSMMNFKNNTNNSQFVISLCPAPSMDGQNVAFGQIISGMELVAKIAKLGDFSGVPKQEVLITDCGQCPNGASVRFSALA